MVRRHLAVAGADGLGLRVTCRGVEEAVDERRVGQPPPGQVRKRPTALSHAAALDDVAVIQPGGDDPFDLTDKAVEHLIQESGGKDLLDGVPDEGEPVDGVEDLQVDPHLRSLRDHVSDLAECLDELLVHQGAAKIAGEHHRGEDLLAPLRAQVTQHLDRGVRRVGDILIEGVLDGAEVIDEAAVTRLIDLGEGEGGEVGDDVLDRRIGVPVEQWDADEKPLVLTPAGNGARVRGQQDHGRGRPVVLAQCPQVLPGLLVEGVRTAGETWDRRRQLGALAHRELRTSGQLGEARAPVLLVLFTVRRVPTRLLLQIGRKAPGRVHPGWLSSEIVMG